MCSLTLLFYNMAQLFDDDLRIIAYFINEDEATKVYRHLLKGNFDRYVVQLQNKLNNFDGDLVEWIEDCKVKLDFSRNELFVHTDFENIVE